MFSSFASTQPWPVSEVGAALQVVTSYDGPYSFVVDIQNDLSPSISSTYRYRYMYMYMYM